MFDGRKRGAKKLTKAFALFNTMKKNFQEAISTLEKEKSKVSSEEDYFKMRIGELGHEKSMINASIDEAELALKNIEKIMSKEL